MGEDFEQQREMEVGEESPGAVKARGYFSMENVRQVFAQTLKDWKGLDGRALLFEQLREAENLFPEKETQYQAMLADLQSREYTSDEEFVEQVGQAVRGFALENFSYQQLGQILAERDKGSKYKPLNEVLSFGGDAELIHIHILPRPEVLAGKKPREKVAFIKDRIRDGLRNLAKRMQTEHRWSQVQEVTATSWLVARHPEVLEELKFRVEGEISAELREMYFKDETRKLAIASMDRDAFLKEYGEE